MELLFLCCLMALSIDKIVGHGMMLDPVARSSRWRYDKSAPTNYDDNGLFCGGFYVQHYVNDGKCGVCGDDYRMAQPRDNELGGIYGQGIIVKSFYENVVKIGVRITANHVGYISFDLCNLDQANRETEECFKTLNFIDGSDKYYVGTTVGLITTNIVFTKGTKCSHCVLRWTYTGGNNWGYCPDGTGALGCGPQETFKNCADISINV